MESNPPLPPTNVERCLNEGPGPTPFYEDPGWLTSAFGSYNPPPPDFYHGGQYVDPAAPNVRNLSWGQGAAAASSIATGVPWPYVPFDTQNPADSPAVDLSTQKSVPGPNVIAPGPTSPGNYIQPGG
jgi:hypothetical protein